MVVTIIKMTVTAEEKLIQVMKKMIVIAVMLVWKLMETTKIRVTKFMKRIACTMPQKTMWTETLDSFQKKLWFCIGGKLRQKNLLHQVNNGQLTTKKITRPTFPQSERLTLIQCQGLNG